MSCPQIWNIEKEKDREKEKVGDRPAKLNEQMSERDKKLRRHFLSEEKQKFCSGSEKMGNACGHEGENER